MVIPAGEIARDYGAIRSEFYATAWEAAVCWDPSGTDEFAVKRLADVRAV